MEVLRLAARTDFRLEKLAGQKVWHVPADDDGRRGARSRLAKARRQQQRHAAGAVGQGPQAARAARRAWAWRDSSSTISASSRWRPADYLRIAHEFHTLIIDRIPVMGFDQRNAAKRFIILIDTLYDHAVKLVASAEAEPDALYQAERRFRGRRVQAHRLAPDRDALAVLPRAAARPARPARDRIERGDRGDVNRRALPTAA